MIKNKIDSIGIIAGQGLLPKIIYDECLKKGIKVKVIGLQDEINEKFFKGVNYDVFKPHNVNSIFNYLKSNNLTNIVIAGKVKRAHLSKLIFDKMGFKILTKIAKSGFNDTSIYSVIIDFFENNGFKIISPDTIADNILAQNGEITNVPILKKEKNDIERGVDILKGIIKHDVGQALVINNGLVLGVEAVEGTNELIKRCSRYKNQEIGGILIKLCKPHQDKRLDLPCIGPDTIKKIAKYSYKGIVIEAKKSIIIASEATIKFANENKIFIYGV